MLRQRVNLEIGLQNVPGLLLLISGVCLLGASLLVPPWLECRKLQWQSDRLSNQAQQLALHEAHYREFLAGLQTDDPVLMERIAFKFFSLKPEGTQLLEQPAQNLVTQARDPRLVAGHPAPPAPFMVEPVESWLGPLPTVAALDQSYQPPHSRLIRWTTGPTRLATLGLALVLVLLGMQPAPVEEAADNRKRASIPRRAQALA